METHHNTTVSISRQRAQRFPLRISLRYRRSTDSRWYEGTTENISSSGALFRADQTVQPNTPIEIQLTLPARVLQGGASQVICRGVIVRIERSADSLQPLVLGTKFLNYRFSRR